MHCPFRDLLEDKSLKLFEKLENCCAFLLNIMSRGKVDGPKGGKWTVLKVNVPSESRRSQVKVDGLLMES